LAIAGLLAVVVLSYQQTLHAYPGGGGSYIVARANLGAAPGLVAAAALLIDYVLTVSVSVAAGVAAITSAAPGLLSHKVALGVVFIAAIAFPTCGRASRPALRAADLFIATFGSSSPRASSGGSAAISMLSTPPPVPTGATGFWSSRSPQAAHQGQAISTGTRSPPSPGPRPSLGG
jgi:amino acid transporter